MAYTNLGGQVRVGVRPAVTAQQLQTATYLFDSYGGAAAAYSLRRLSATYSGSAIRVRRSVDNAEQNIGFDANGGLDTSSLLSFANVSDTSTTKLLDLYSGAAVAYSLRKLSSTYSGSAIRVRRSSDNAEQNIGFNSDGSLDTVSLLSFVGSGNGFVTTWYDQSGNVRNAFQSSAASQPKIVNSGSLILENGKPTVSFTTSHTLATDTQNLSFYDCAISFVSKNISGSGAVGIFGYGTNGQQNRNRYLGTYISTLTFFYWGTDNQSNITGMGDTTSSLYSLNFQSSSANFYKNSSTQTNSVFTLLNTTSSSFAINEIYTRGERANINFSEGIFYTSGMSTNMSGIRSNQNSYYSLYTSTGNAFVTTWYDQSGNGRNVTQATSANQPRIVNAGSFDTLSGKPSIYFDGSNDCLDTSDSGMPQSGTTVLHVSKYASNSVDQSFIVNWGSGTTGGAFYNMYWNSGVALSNYGQAFALSSRLNVDNISVITKSVGTSGYRDWRINVNSVLSNTLSMQSNTTLYGANGFRIGRVNPSQGNTYPMLGYISEVIIWPTDLYTQRTSLESNANSYYSIWDSSIVQSGLVMNLDASFKSSYSGTGTSWIDISSNGKNATLINGPIFGTAGGGSFLFNASNQQIRVGSVTSGLTLTYNMWIRIPSISLQLLFWDGSSASGNDFWTVLTSDGKIRTLIDNSTYLTSNSSITANTWYNISIVTTSTGKSIYINGVLDSSDNTPILTRTGYSYLSLGYAFDGSNDVQSWMGGTNLRGNIGSFNIYNRSLSATEVLQNFNATKSRFGL